MCERLGELRQAMVAFGGGFEPALLSVAEAEAVVGEAAAIEHVAATVKALAAARVASRGTTGRAAASTHETRRLAATTGTSVGAARHALELGRRLADQPELAARARTGALSAEQAGLIAEAGEANPAAVDELVGQAGQGASVAELRQEVAKVKAAACSDLEARRQEIHKRRRLRSWTDPDGVWHISGCGNPEAGAQLDSVLTPLTEERFYQARREGRREHPDAYRFDALIDFAHQAAGRGPASPHDAPPNSTGARRRRRTGAPVKLLVRVDYDTFLRGAPVDGETCELVGYGPISVAAVHHLLEGGDPFVAAVLTKAKQIVGVAHLGRQPTAHQQSALEWLYPSCAALGCPHQARLQTDHRIDWAQTNFTMFDLLDRLCAYHHGLKTRDGWALVPGVGKRAFVPPSDPRHPRNHPPPQTAAA